MKAKELLEDAKIAHAMLEVEEDEQRLRVLWIACITILRSVGHVLAKVDSKENAALDSAIDAWWKNLKENKTSSNRIFYDFIDCERNFTIKEYRVCYDEDAPLSFGFEDSDGTFTFFSEAGCKNLFLPVIEGPYQGEDFRELVLKSITWWESQISEIESATNQIAK